jgi:hypothetical protein
MRGELKLWVHTELEAIYLPGALWDTLLHWYHDCLQHMQATMKEH